MRILFDHQAFSLQNVGGITRYFYELLRGLNAKVEVESVTALGFTDTVWPMVEAAKPNGRILHFGRPVVRHRKLRYIANELVLGALVPALGKFDIYHNSLYRYMPSARTRRRVGTHHDCIYERFPQHFANSDQIIRTKRKMFRESDLVICVSEASRQDLLDFYDIDVTRTIVIHHGVHVLPRTKRGAEELKALRLRPFVLYVGARYFYKNFSGLLRAFARSRAQEQFELLALGGGTVAPSERRLVAELGLRDSVVFVERASNDLLAEAYASAALFVYPSLYEGFGMPPLEAMASGCPTLVARTKATEEVCGSAATFFDPNQDDDFVENLSSMLSTDAIREQNVLRGKKLAANYTWEATVNRTLDAYRSLQ